MKKTEKREIYINRDKNGTTRIAVVEDGELREIIAEREGVESVVNNVYAGIVKTILPNGTMFVDIGRKKNVFIHLSDKRESGLFDKKGKCTVKSGDTVLVRIIRDSAGEKGMLGTTELAFAGVYFVVSNSKNETLIGVSKKIEDHSERKRLSKIVKRNLPENGCFDVVVRTKCESYTEEELVADLSELISLCLTAESKWRFIKAPALVYDDGSVVERAIRGLYRESSDQIIYDEDGKLFQKLGLEQKIKEAVNKKVRLKSGGFLIIEKTEACFVIDVNSGKFAGVKDHGQSVLKTNLEAAEEIAVQLRLRNLSGIIIVDFIDMKSETDKTILLDFLDDKLKNDRIPVTLVGMTELGLVQITRKKTRESIENSL